MTDKELHKLNRHKLLELLLSQSKDVNQQRTQIDELADSLSEAESMIGYLKAKLDDKDAQLDKLKGRLDTKDATITTLKNQISTTGSTASAPASAPAYGPQQVPAAQMSAETMRDDASVGEAPAQAEARASETSAASAGQSAVQGAAVPPSAAAATTLRVGESAMTMEEFMTALSGALQQYTEQREGVPRPEPKEYVHRQGPTMRERLGARFGGLRDTLAAWGGVWSESWNDFQGALLGIRWRDTDLYAAMRKKAADYFRFKT